MRENVFRFLRVCLNKNSSVGQDRLQKINGMLEVFTADDGFNQ